MTGPGGQPVAWADPTDCIAGAGGPAPGINAGGGAGEGGPSCRRPQQPGRDLRPPPAAGWLGGPGPGFDGICGLGVDPGQKEGNGANH